VKSALESCRSRSLRPGTLALAAALAVGAIATTPAEAGVEIRNGSGVGATAELQSSHVLAGRSITATARVFVVVPADSSTPAFLAVGVTEVDDESGEELFAGNGTGAPDNLQVDADLGHVHVQGQITAHSATSDATRVVDVNVVWNADSAVEAIDVRTHDRGGVSEKHEGVVGLMTATGNVRIEDPDGTDHVITVTGPASGSVWDTTDTGRKLPPPPDSLSSAAAADAAASTVTVTTTATGHWTGYWKYNTATQQWIWTWVWVWDTGSWVTS
jgi:hypothetical protein